MKVKVLINTQIDILIMKHVHYFKQKNISQL